MKNLFSYIVILILLDIEIVSAQTGAISGFVYDSSNEPIFDVSVRASLSSGTYFEQRANTSEDGSYVITNLPVGLYSVRVFNTKGYVNEFYNDVLNQSDATLVKVNVDETVENINFYLQRGSFITGRIYTIDGQPITSGVAINFYDANSKTQRGNTSSDDHGFYVSPALPAGEHVLMAGNPGQGYVFTFYENAMNWKDARILQITSDDTLTGIDFYLEKGGAITGKVSAEDDPDEHIRAWIVVKDYHTGQWCSEAWSDSVTGYYCAGGLRPGDYIVFTYSANPTKYHTQYFWKSARFENAKIIAVAAADTIRNINFHLIPVKYEHIKNDHVHITVSDKYPGTNLTLGTIKGLPDTDFDDHKDLLFGHPYPHTSYTTVQINKNNYIFGSQEGDYLYDGNIMDPAHRSIPQADPDGTKITWSWICKQVIISQSIAIVQSEWSDKKIFDTAKIKYTMTNIANFPQSVGLRILLDTMLGENDGAPIQTPDAIFTDHERNFVTQDIPIFWTAVEGDSTRTEFSAQGTLVGYGATTPDRFATVKWRRIFNALWDYQTEDTCKIIHDSAVALWWNPILLNPDETREIVTYYGLGEMIPDTIPPYIDELSPDRQTIAEPNTNIILHVKDDYMGVDGKTIKMWIGGIQVHPDTSSDDAKKNYRLFYDPTHNFQYDDTVKILVEAEDKAYKPNSMHEEYTFFIVRDTIPPYIEDLYPPHAATGIPLDTTISFSVKDDHSGVKFVKLLIDSTEAPMEKQNNDRYIYKPLEFFTENDTIEFTIIAEDQATTPNRLEQRSYFVTVRDTIPPWTEGHRPAKNETGVSLKPVINVQIKDDFTGVDSTSILMEINKIRVFPVLERVKLGYQLTYQPDTNFHYNQTVTISIRASDLAKATNPMPPDIYEFYTMEEQDTIPPFTTGHHPEPYSHNVSPDDTIIVEIKDEQSGVDRDSIMMKINFEVVNPKILEIAKGYRLSFKPVYEFKYNDSVTVEIDAQDLASEPNKMKTDHYQFYIEKDATPPRIIFTDPGDLAKNVPLETNLKFDIYDDQLGIDSSSITIWIDNNKVDAVMAGNKKHYSIECQARNLKYNQQVSIKVLVQDLAEPPNDTTQTFSFATIEDKEPPYTIGHVPEKYATNVDFYTPIRFHIKDDVAGVDLSSIVLTVEGDTIEFRYNGNPRDYEIIYQPEYNFNSGQKVDLTISAKDLSNPQNEMYEEYDFRINDMLPDLITTLSIDSPKVIVHHTVILTAEIMVKNAPVNMTFDVMMKISNQLFYSTTISRMNTDEVKTMSVPYTLHEKGKYKISVQVDPKNMIHELNEDNNEAVVSVAVVEGELIVRSNPFTPNGDGINDEVGFDFKEFSLNVPILKLFDFQGRNIINLDQYQDSRFIWDGKDDTGRDSQPGVYLYILQDGKRNVARGYVVLAR